MSTFSSAKLLREQNAEPFSNKTEGMHPIDSVLRVWGVKYVYLLQHVIPEHLLRVVSGKPNGSQARKLYVRSNVCMQEF